MSHNTFHFKLFAWKEVKQWGFFFKRSKKAPEVKDLECGCKNADQSWTGTGHKGRGRAFSRR
jgi:hypothetical protein